MSNYIPPKEPASQPGTPIPPHFVGQQLTTTTQNRIGNAINKLQKQVLRPRQTESNSTPDSSIIDVQIQDPEVYDSAITDGIWRVQPVKVKKFIPDTTVGTGAADPELIDCYLRTINRPEVEATEPEFSDLFNTLDELGDIEVDPAKHSPRYDVVFIKDEVLKAHFIVAEDKTYFLIEAKGIVPVPETNEICA